VAIIVGSVGAVFALALITTLIIVARRRKNQEIAKQQRRQEKQPMTFTNSSLKDIEASVAQAAAHMMAKPAPSKQQDIHDKFEAWLAAPDAETTVVSIGTEDDEDLLESAGMDQRRATVLVKAMAKGIVMPSLEEMDEVEEEDW
jgi:hypothetical protein